MSRFVSGFAAASVLWGAVAIGLWLAGVIGPVEEEELAMAPLEEPAPAIEEPAEDDAKSRRRRRRGRRGPSGSGGAHVPSGNATTGDSLGENDPRYVDMESGGEQQLASSEIEAGFDQAFGRIRRCLVLAAGDGPVSGRLTFGLRIAGSGRVTRVNLAGPAAVTTGESGDCLRETARSIRFRSFDGPDMVVHYPVTLD